MKEPGQPENVRAVNGLIGWDIVLCILAVISAQGIIVLIMATLLVYCLVCVYRLSQTLDEIGYALTPTPSRIGPRGMLGIYFGTLFRGCLFCFLLFSLNAEARIQERYSRGLCYAHQISLRQYPVLSAKNYMKQGEMFSAKAPFTLITPASWFFPKDSSPAEPAGERTD